ncbi:MAG TPA: hypothetical protein VKZ60_10945 [Chloroflexota bacterium]|nr:hypothetical protein [Chloroflexota bacterium]
MAGAAPPFPDCWLAYGATNDELRAFGRVVVLRGSAELGRQLAVQLVLALLGLLGGLAPLPPAWRLAAGLLALVSLASATTSWLQRCATPRTVVLTDEGVRLAFASGTERSVAWEGIGEIGLAEQRGQRGVGLRLRPAHAAVGPRWRVPARLLGGFDLVLWPRDGDAELLGRVLLRYCIDPRARRRYLAAASPPAR